MLQQYLPFTVLKQTCCWMIPIGSTFELQQYLPFTVLKRINGICCYVNRFCWLQQYLPFTVLKQCSLFFYFSLISYIFATVLTVYGIIRKIKYSKINKNHGICRGFLFPSFSDYFLHTKTHIM